MDIDLFFFKSEAFWGVGDEIYGEIYGLILFAGDC